MLHQLFSTTGSMESAPVTHTNLPSGSGGVGVREVSFSADAHAGTSNANPTEYAAIAVCSVLLGLVLKYFDEKLAYGFVY